MRQWKAKKQILILLWANFPIFLQMLNFFINRNNPVREKIDGYLNWLIVINLSVMLVLAIFIRLKQRSEEQKDVEVDNKLWNDRMKAKYDNWQNA